MTNTRELIERFEKLAEQAEADEDVGAELRMLAYELEEASESVTNADEVRALLVSALDARAYADRLERWRDIVRRRRLRE